MKKILFILFELICLVLFCLGCYLIWEAYSDRQETKQITEQILSDVVTVNEKNSENNSEAIDIDFQKLLTKNPDTVGWLQIPDTTIQYPVVQTNNNDFYLNHSFDLSKNKAGWIFADYRNDLKNFDENTILYGHNRKDGSMFGSLSLLLSPDWYENELHHFFDYSTLSETRKVEIFSVYQIPEEDYYIQTSFQSREDYQTFLTTLSNRSTIPFSVTISPEDKILTLSTCASNNKYRTVIHGKILQ